MTFPARAENYAASTWDNLARTLVRFNALDIGTDEVLDEYAAITNCDLYKANYGNDFKWNEFRKQIRDDAAKNASSYPDAYTYKIRVRLDRYDFQDNLFRLSEKTPVRNINAIMLFEADGPACGAVRPHFVPGAYRAVLDPPVDIPGLEISPEEGRALLQRMSDAHNPDRFVFARFNMHIVYIDKLGHLLARSQSDPIRLDGRVDSVEFFEDKDFTKPLWTYTPPKNP